MFQGEAAHLPLKLSHPENNMSDPRPGASERDIRTAREIGVEISSSQVADLSRQDILFDATENPSDEIPQNGSNPHQEGVPIGGRLQTVEVERFVYLMRLALARHIQAEKQRRYEAEMHNDDLKVIAIDSGCTIYEKIDGTEIVNQLQSEDLQYMEAIAVTFNLETETVKPSLESER
jgi:hypothetical protein